MKRQNGSPRVGVFRWEWLPGSETFIRRQCDDLRRTAAVPIGAVPVPSVLRRPDDLILYQGRVSRKLVAPIARRLGWSPRLSRALAREQLDLLHVHFAVDAIAARRTLRRARVPVVVTLHGYDITREPSRPGLGGRRYRKHLARLFGEADQFIAVSEFIAARALALGAPPGKVKVLRIGIPVPAELGDVDVDVDVLFVGRLVEKKGVDDLFAALHLLRTEGLEVRCTVVGDGPRRADLEALAERMLIDVAWTGGLPAPQVAALMRRARVVAVPSRTAEDGDAEGLPTVLMEAMAAGVPVVATRHSGIPEAIEHGVTGLLSEERDAVGLARNIRRVLEDEPLGRALAAQALGHAREELNMSVQTALLEGVYLDLVARRLSSR